MGKYINKVGEKLAPARNKAQFLIDEAGATVTEPVFQKNLVCVVSNMAFDAAAYAYDEDEFRDFLEDRSGRRKVWLIVPDADKLAH